VIEIDGESHHWEGMPEKDAKRQKDLKALGLHFLRFDDLVVKQDIDIVLNEIENWVNKNESQSINK
jgi:very-short-patch-repair endonuclease